MNNLIPPLVKRLSLAFERELSRYMVEEDLTPSQASVLGFILSDCREDKPLCARDVEEGLHLSHATTAGLLARLAEKGFLTFERSGEDSRVKLIRLTEKSIRQDRFINEQMIRIESSLLGALSPQEREIFRGMLVRLVEDMERRSTE